MTPDTMTALLRQLSARITRLEGRRPGPRFASGRLTRTGNGSVALVYPMDLFDSPPTLLVTIEGAHTPPFTITQATAAGATVTVTAAGTVTVNWLAIDANDGT